MGTCRLYKARAQVLTGTFSSAWRTRCLSLYITSLQNAGRVPILRPEGWSFEVLKFSARGWNLDNRGLKSCSLLPSFVRICCSHGAIHGLGTFSMGSSIRLGHNCPHSKRENRYKVNIVVWKRSVKMTELISREVRWTTEQEMARMQSIKWWINQYRPKCSLTGIALKNVY